MRNLLVAVAVACGVFLTLAPVHAEFRLRYSLDGGSNFTVIVDDDANDTNKNPGNIQVDLAGVNIHASWIGATTVTDTTVDLAVNGSSLSGALQLVVDATVNDLITMPPPQNLEYEFTGSIGSNAVGVTQAFQTWIDDNNQFFGGASGIGGTNIVADTGSLAIPSSGSVTFSASDPYSITAEMVVFVTSSTGNYGISNDSLNEITAAPAPAGLLLVLAAMPMLCIAVLLRRRQMLQPVSAV